MFSITKVILLLSLFPLSGFTQTVPGNTTTQFTVTPSGSANFTVPIQAPPVGSQMAPQYALVYDSGAQNGFLGQGWQLSGLSFISRCPKTMASDGARGGVAYSMQDRYCLDGQRLILTSGTYGVAGSEYRFEKDNFSKILAFGAAGNGPAYFVLKTKSGTEIEFGNTSDSRIEAQGKPTVSIWAKNKVKDVNGNFATNIYSKDAINGEYYLIQSNYGGNTNNGLNANNSIQFNYVARNDPSYDYQAGSIARSTKVLVGIKTFANGTAVKEYKVGYGGALVNNGWIVTSVQECNASTPLSCFAPILFDWNSASTNEGTAWQGWGGTTSGFSIMSCKLNQFADMNGDGLDDQVCGYDYGQYEITYVKLNQGGNFAGWQAWGSASTSFELARCHINTMVDMNGDGKPDQVCSYNYANGTNSTFVKLNTGSSLSAWQTWATNYAGVGVGSCHLHQLADVNGDGLPDEICGYNYGTYETTFAKTNNGSGLSTWFTFSPSTSSFANANCAIHSMIDMNGDGLADEVCTYNYGSSEQTYVKLSLGNSLSSWNWWGGTSTGVPYANCKLHQLADVNGDGLPDQVCGYDYGNYDKTFVKINTGAGFNPWLSWSANSSGFSLAQCIVSDMVDMNGDGMADQVCNYNYGSYERTFVKLSRGNVLSNWLTWAPQSPVGSFNPSNCASHEFVDVTGDGLPDQVCTHNYSQLYEHTFVKKNTAETPRIKKIYTSASDPIDLQYAQLSDSSVYVRDLGANAAVQPKVDQVPVMQVVKAVTIANGIGGLQTANYSYGGYKYERGTGRGALGFRWTKNLSLATNLETYSEYLQTWPYTGETSKTETRLAGSGNAGILKRTVSTMACKTPYTGAACTSTPGSLAYAYPAQTVEDTWDLNGSLMSSITTNITMANDPVDGKFYGDVEQATVTSSDGFQKTTQYTYWPADAANWRLGRVKNTTVTSTQP